MAEKSFENALTELENLVKELENGNIELDKAVVKYNEGMELAKYCHKLLDNAQNVIVKQMKDSKESDFE